MAATAQNVFLDHLRSNLRRSAPIIMNFCVGVGFTPRRIAIVFGPGQIKDGRLAAILIFAENVNFLESLQFWFHCVPWEKIRYNAYFLSCWNPRWPLCRSWWSFWTFSDKLQRAYSLWIASTGSNQETCQKATRPSAIFPWHNTIFEWPGQPITRKCRQGLKALAVLVWHGLYLGQGQDPRRFWSKSDSKWPPFCPKFCVCLFWPKNVF